MTSSQRLVGFALTACGAAMAASVALATAASAATITLDRPCYVNTASGPATMTISGAGFTPNEAVRLTGGPVNVTPTVDASGAFTTTAAAPGLAATGPGTLATTLNATDAATGHTVATAKALSANLSVSTKPGSIPAKDIRKRKILFTFSGFTPGKNIYGYYLRKKVVAKSRFGKAQGPCGTLKQKALLFPGGHPTKNQYVVAFESMSRYSAKAFPSVVGKLSILSF